MAAKLSLEMYRVPGVNDLGRHGRWPSADPIEICRMKADFAERVEAEFGTLIETALDTELAPA